MSETNTRKNTKKIILKPKTLEKLLEFRARGYSYATLAKIFRLNSRQMMEKIIKNHRNDIYLQKYYIEIDKTFKFLNREI